MRNPILLMLASGLLIGCSSRTVAVESPRDRSVVVPEKSTGKSAGKQPEAARETKAAKAGQKAEKKADKAAAKAEKKSEKASGNAQKGNGKPAHAASHGPRKLRGVPPGHYPPEGKCRLWYDGRAPGQQPKPTDCAKLKGKVPRDAFVLYNGKDWDAQYDWSRVKRGTVPKTVLEVLLSVNR